MSKRPHTVHAALIEWILGAVSGCAVVTIVGYLIWQGFSDTLQASLRIEASPTVANDNLRFAVWNDGGRTATDVAVSLRLTREGKLIAEQTIFIDYVPGHSNATGSFLLPADSQALAHDLVVEGYLDP